MRNRLFVVLTLAAVLLSACAGSEVTATPQVIRETVVQKETVVVTQEVEVTKQVDVVREVQVLALPQVDPLSVTGDIVTAGSSTVFPLSEAMRVSSFSAVRFPS